MKLALIAALAGRLPPELVEAVERKTVKENYIEATLFDVGDVGEGRILQVFGRSTNGALRNRQRSALGPPRGPLARQPPVVPGHNPVEVAVTRPIHRLQIGPASASLVVPGSSRRS